MRLFRDLLWFFRQHARVYLLALSLLAAVASLTAVLPWLTGQVVDGLIEQTLAPEALWRLIALMVLVAVLIYGLRYSWRVRLFGTSYLLGRSLRTRLFERYSLQGADFYRARRSGDLMALATNDIDAIEMAAGEAVLAGFDGSLTFVLVLGLMIGLIDWRLTLVALLPLPFMAWAFYRISSQIHRHYREALRSFSALNDHTHEVLSGVRTVKAMGAEQRMLERFAHWVDKTAEDNYQAQRWEAAYDPAIAIGMSSTFVLTLGFGGYLVYQQQLSLGQLTAFSLYTGQLLWPMFAFGWLLNLLERGAAAWERYSKMMSEPLSLEDRGKITELEQSDVCFEAVSFHYPGALKPALCELSLTLPAGKTLGIVGPVGSGKSTLLRVLLRQVEPTSGRVTLGGVVLADIQLACLRQQLAWVPQEPLLFSGTVADNIALSLPEADEQAIVRVAKQACVAEDIEALPQRYQTRVGERGVSLSGGQRQRVALARALLKPAPILLLDDVLSAVDHDTERAIIEQLEHAMPRSSRIITSHRLSAVTEADEILVLIAGQVVARGTHQTLLADTESWYAKMWQYQCRQEASAHGA